MRSVIFINIGFIFFTLISFNAFAQAGMPSVYLKFKEDKIYVLNNEKVEFTADVFIGSPDKPVENLYAVGLEIIFPAELVLSDSTYFTYHPQSFLGQSSEITISQKNQALDKGRFHIAVSRTSGKSINGFGKIGTVHFITVSDIIGSRAMEEVPFNATIENVLLLDANGNQLSHETDEDGETVLLINDILARSARAGERLIEIYPNPVSDQLHINLRNLHGEALEIFDIQGQRVQTEPIRSQNVHVFTENFQPGIYLIRIRTEEGIFTKRILVER